MLKTHCVTNLRASTQRCACCVLELLSTVVMQDLDMILISVGPPKQFRQ
jgi:hypothetical protein